MTLPEAAELLDYFADNPPTHRALAIVYQFKKRQPEAGLNVTPEIFQQLAPGGTITLASLAGIRSGKAQAPNA